ncbi:putative carboxypeptidase [Lachnellula suecica]|uniref:Putative carboxypeptidase n=1 Tax=Lachnellula suecica TaxID=602035 RepID=A0A8T9C4X7_9HELO|nr:putative carboxypeptidase [Lachnellula suecica]
MATEVVPAALKKGDTIAFVSPSSRCNDIFLAATNRAKSHFESLGFKVNEIFTSPLSSDFHERTLQRCAELHAAFSDPEVKCVLCTSGGTTSNELVRHLDYDLIKKNPKIFCGYSDITILHYALYTQCGLRTFYGPTAIGEFGEAPSPDSFTTDHFLRVLTGEGAGPVPRSLQWTTEPPDFFVSGDSSMKARTMRPTPPWRWLRPGTASAPLIGGCLTILMRVKGTKFWPSHKGTILLLENAMGEGADLPIPVQRTASFMADMGNVGVWDDIVGLVIGRPYAYDEKMSVEFRKMVLEQCSGTSFPILVDVDVGHTSPMVTLPLNGMVKLDSKADEFSILEKGVVS